MSTSAGIIAHHVRALAKATGTNARAVHAVTDHHASAIASAAHRAYLTCPGEGDWIGTAMACNAASNRHARTIIEHKAAALFADLIKPASTAP